MITLPNSQLIVTDWQDGVVCRNSGAITAAIFKRVLQRFVCLCVLHSMVLPRLYCLNIDFDDCISKNSP